MPKVIQKTLQDWRVQQGNPTIGLVFPSPVTGKRLTKKHLKNCWTWIKEDADVQRNLELYTLRHNFISWLIMTGIPLKVIAGLVGHQTTSMIEKHYGHLSPCITAQASNSFANLLD